MRVVAANGRTVALYLSDGPRLRTAPRFSATVVDQSFQVADAYFAVQQARGELAGALLAETMAADLTRRATALAAGLAPPAEENRAKVELARRRQAVFAARERWRTAGAELGRLLRP